MKAETAFTVGQKDARAGPLALCVFAFVFCTRAWLIKVWATPVPAWDEWNATALGLLKPWLTGVLKWSDLFAAHNEHRIVLTRLADLALFWADGRWNPWWQLMLGAALHAATAATLLCSFWRFLDPAAQAIMALSLALLFSMTSGWQNALWAFQSSFYFFELLTVLALGGLLLARPWSNKWLLGWFAAFFALFSVSSGLLAAATAGAIGGLSLLAEQSSLRRSSTVQSIAPLLALSPLVIAGTVLHIESPDHAQMCAQTLAQFCAIFFRCLSWPWIDSPWAFLALQAPLLGLIASLIRQRRPPDGLEKLLLGLGLLLFLHAAAIAYSRGNILPEARPFSRYQDTMLLGPAANLCILLRYAAKLPLVRVAALLWTGFLLAGMLLLMTVNFSKHLPYTRAQGAARLAQVRNYLITHDPQILRPDNEALRLNSDPALVQGALDDPILRKAWPREFTDASVRPPWLVVNSPWLTLMSFFTLQMIALQFWRPRR